VLVEKPGRMAGQMIGRSPYLQSVHFDGAPRQVGSILNCRIDGIMPNSLSATVVE
jgi:tRNA-2-methylthio-N6-dimethylallyladenosine synthase